MRDNCDWSTADGKHYCQTLALPRELLKFERCDQRGQRAGENLEGSINNSIRQIHGCSRVLVPPAKLLEETLHVGAFNAEMLTHIRDFGRVGSDRFFRNHAPTERVSRATMKGSATG